jgi:pimeloyl-ACP methyl ester carboxylesterase
VSAPNRLWRLVRRLLRVFAALAFCAVLAVGVLWLEHSLSIELPKPTGTFRVGRTLYDWVDDQNLDPLAPAGAKRELLVWVWYPAAAEPSSGKIAEYVPDATRKAVERDRGPLNLLTRDLSKVHTHSLLDADVSPQQRSYPVVIMRAGASLEVWNYSTLAEDLASHGYIVVGIDAPYRAFVAAFPDGRVIRRLPENNPELCIGRASEEQARCVNRFLTAWTADIGYVLDRLGQLNTSDPSRRFTGRLDMTRVGIFGHSFGGAQAAQFCSQDPRCKAGIDVDGSLHGSVLQSGIATPFMFLGSGKGDFSSSVEVSQVESDIKSVYDRQPANGRLRVSIRGANHFTFSDEGALLRSHAFRWVLRKIGKLGIDGSRQLAVTSYCIRSFFDAHLKQTTASQPTISSSLYPEIQVVE